MSSGNEKIAGNLRLFRETWGTYTSDPFILQCIRGYKIEFKKNSPPQQESVPRGLKFSGVEKEIIRQELAKFISKGVIEEVSHSPGEYISNIFIRPKKEAGAYRVILNLKSFNENIQYHKFKMDTFQSILSLISPNCLMQSVDIKDAYYCVAIAKSDRKYLRFRFDNRLYQFTCLPNGLASGPRIYTKICKPASAKLQQMGVTITGYIDDSLIISDTVEEAQASGQQTVEVLQELGFLINWEKTALDPSTNREYLGFIIDSTNMTVTLPDRKKIVIVDECTKLLRSGPHSIRSVAQVIGILVSSLPAVQYGQLHYRALEQDKIVAVQENRGEYDGTMELSDDATDELEWWISNVNEAFTRISHGLPSHVLFTDASLEGWGVDFEGETTGGPWSLEERYQDGVSINYLELLAAFLALQSFCAQMRSVHIGLRMDNTTAIAYITHMGGARSVLCNSLAKEIWQWCITRDIWLSASHVPGVENVAADFESRHFNEDAEWKLNTVVFNRIVQAFGPFDIDLFASRLNTQLPVYVSWRPDPQAQFVDAFSISWHGYNCYLFPPFSVISRCLRKVVEDQANGVIVVPLWTTRSWFTLLMKMLVSQPLILPRGPNLLKLPGKNKVHRLANRMTLLACHISGRKCETVKFWKKQAKLFGPHGRAPQRDNTVRPFGSGDNFVIEGTLIHFRGLLANF